MDPKDLKRIADKVAGQPGTVRTAGKIEFVKDTGPLRRDVRAPGFEWSPESFGDLAKILWAAQRAQSYSIAALRIFSKIPSSKFSPDGLLGGRGYIQSVKDMRAHLGQAAEILAAFTDTIHDEVNADHWKAKDDGVADDAEQQLIADAEQVKSNPEDFVEGEFKEVQGPSADIDEPLTNPDPEEMNPAFESEDSDDSEADDDGADDVQYQNASDVNDFWLKGEVFTFGNAGELRDEPDYSVDSKKPGSKTPTDKTDQKQGKSEAEITMNTTTVDHGSYASSFTHMLRTQKASSSLPVDTLPGPRVDHIGPGEGTEAGHFNWENLWPSDHPGGEGMSSGTNESDYIYDDGTGDGNTGNDNPTDGDSSVLMTSSVKDPKLAHNGYSWLPGSRNEKNMPYYDKDLSQEDIDWMVAHSDPDPVDKVVKEKPRFTELWEFDI